MKSADARRLQEYKTYIASSAWKDKRDQRLSIDDRKCVVCKQSATSVHHLHYDTLGNEDPLTDLVSTCGHCHHYFDTIERFIRYKRRERKPIILIEVSQTRKEHAHGMDNSILRVDITLPDDHAQRADRRPTQQIRKSIEACIVETDEDRFGFRGNGTH